MWKPANKQIIQGEDGTSVEVGSHGALHVATHMLYHTFEGEVYLSSHFWDAGLDGVMNLLWLSPVTTKYFPFISIISSTAEASYQVFEGPTYSDPGTGLTRINRDLTLPRDVSEVLTYHTPTVSVDGTQLFETRWGSGGKVGGASTSLALLLKSNTAYLFRVTSRATGNHLTYQMNWGEIE